MRLYFYSQKTSLVAKGIFKNKITAKNAKPVTTKDEGGGGERPPQ